MLPREREILSELRSRDVWKRWHRTFDKDFFRSRDAKQVRRGLEMFHGNGSSEAVVPVDALCRYVGGKRDDLHLDDPLPPHVGSDKLERIAVTYGVKQELELLGKRMERGEDLSGTDLEGLRNFLGSVESARGADREALPLLSAQELVESRSWETRGTIPTFLHQGLDEYLGGGVGRGQLCVLQAPAKKGKSTLLLHVAYHAAKSGFRTLFLSCENYLDQLGERLGQIHVLTRRKRLPPRLKLQYKAHLSLEDVRAYVEEMGQVDFLVIDYFGRMSSVVDHDWTWRTTEIFSGLRDDVANPHDLVCWTATQAHDTPDFVRTSQRASIWGSRTQGQLADLWLGVETVPKMNRCTFTVHGRRGRGKEGGSFHSFFNVDTAEIRDL